MYSFDETVLVDELGRLPSQARIAFTAAAATRQLCNYERLARELDEEPFCASTVCVDGQCLVLVSGTHGGTAEYRTEIEARSLVSKEL